LLVEPFEAPRTPDKKISTVAENTVRIPVISRPLFLIAISRTDGKKFDNPLIVNNGRDLNVLEESRINIRKWEDMTTQGFPVKLAQELLKETTDYRIMKKPRSKLDLLRCMSLQ